MESTDITGMNSDAVQCDGWKETAHQTHYPVAAIELYRGVVHLCPVCVVDCYDDVTLTQEERDAAKTVFDAMYRLIPKNLGI